MPARRGIPQCCDPRTAPRHDPNGGPPDVTPIARPAATGIRSTLKRCPSLEHFWPEFSASFRQARLVAAGRKCTSDGVSSPIALLKSTPSYLLRSNATFAEEHEEERREFYAEYGRDVARPNFNASTAPSSAISQSISCDRSSDEDRRQMPNHG